MGGGSQRSTGHGRDRRAVHTEVAFRPRGPDGARARPVTWHGRYQQTGHRSTARDVTHGDLLREIEPLRSDLSLDAKRRALTEARRVLRPAGRLLIADWGRAHDPVMRIAFTAVQLLDGFQTTRPHASGELPGLIEAAGFAVRPLDRVRTMWGTLDLLAATPTQAPHIVAVQPPPRRMPPL